MWKKALVLFVFALTLLVLLPNSAHAAEECKRDHTDQKNFAFIGSCTDMKCFYCDYIWENAISMHIYDVSDGVNKYCSRCGKLQCNHPNCIYFSCTEDQCVICGEIIKADTARHNLIPKDNHAVCATCGYATCVHTPACVDYFCSLCHHAIRSNDPNAHNYITTAISGCTTYKTCSFCGVQTTEVAHDLQLYYNGCQRFEKCTRCNLRVTTLEPKHKFSVYGDIRTCRRCGYSTHGDPPHVVSTPSAFLGITFCYECKKIVFTDPPDILSAVLLSSGLIFMLLVFIFAFRMRSGQPKNPRRTRKRAQVPGETPLVCWSLCTDAPDILPHLPQDDSPPPD